MIEIIDVDNNIKMKSMIICGIELGKVLYVIYAIKRNEREDNIFGSRLVVNSEGYTMDNNFSNGEKEGLDKAILHIINKEDIDRLKSAKIKIVEDISLAKVNKFSSKKCYIATYDRDTIQDIMMYYNLLDINSVPMVERRKITDKVNVWNIFLVILGILVLVICIWAIIVVFVK